MKLKKSIATCFLAILGFAIVARDAIAQIDHRVNTGNAATAGFARDRNPGIGTGGYNLAGPGFDAGYRANAIITGNVTGLGGFKGFSPILQTNAFRGELQSTTLSGFIGRSVGVGDLRPNSVPTQNYYFDPTRTVVDAGIATRAESAPGPSRVMSNALAPPAQGAFGIRQVGPKIKDPQDRRLGVETIPTAPPARRLPPNPAQVRNLRTALPFRAAMQSSIFGTRSDEETWEPNELSHLESGPNGVDTAITAMPSAATPPDQLRPGDLPARGVSNVVTESFEKPIQRDQANEAVAPGVRQRSITAPQDSESAAVEQGPAGSGLDRFADLAMAARLLNSAPAVSSQVVPGNINPVSPTAGIATELKWARNLKDKPIRTFVGTNTDRLNQYLASAEEALHSGQYYKASRLFDLAGTIDHSNPLPLLGRGHALAAAGDFRSAIYSLLSAVKRFPEIATFKLDLPSLVGRSDAFDRRRAELENMLKSSDDPGLRFLLGYIEYFSGLVESGKSNLFASSKAAAMDSPIKAFVDALPSSTNPTAPVRN